MEINTVIEVQALGDFDVLYTDCIMVSSDKQDVNELFKEFYLLMGIDSNKGLDMRYQREMTEDLVAFLEIKGFSKLITHPIYFCD